MYQLESLHTSTRYNVHGCVCACLCRVYVWACVRAHKCFHREDLRGVVKERKAIKVK